MEPKLKCQVANYGFVMRERKSLNLTKHIGANNNLLLFYIIALEYNYLVIGLIQILVIWKNLRG